MYELLMHERTHPYIAAGERATQTQRAGIRELLRLASLRGRRDRTDRSAAMRTALLSTDRVALRPS
jgi:hypothetical protein